MSQMRKDAKSRDEISAAICGRNGKTAGKFKPVCRCRAVPRIFQELGNNVDAEICDGVAKSLRQMIGEASAAATNIDQRMPGTEAGLDQKFSLGGADGLIIPAADGKRHRLIERPFCS